MQQQSWVIAYIDSSRPFESPAGWPRPLRRIPDLFAILARPNERVIGWKISDVAADRLANELRELVEVVMVVPSATVWNANAPLVRRGVAAYDMLEDSWIYQLQYLDPGSQSRLGAEWGLAEGTYESDTGPISLIEHRYILEGLSENIPTLKDTIKARKWKVTENGRYRAQTVAEASLDQLIKADEPQLRAVLSRQIDRQDLSYDELLALPAFLTIGLFERLAAIIHGNRVARSDDVIARRGVEVFSTLTNQAAEQAIGAFRRVASPTLASSLNAALANEPELRHFLSATGGTASAGELRAFEEQRRRRFARYVTVARLLARLDWILFLEAVDPAYAELRADPGKIYPTMTPESRQHYRLEIAGLARWTKRTDFEIAQAVTKASKGGHNGDVLFGTLRLSFEQSIAAKPPFNVALARHLTRYPTATYFQIFALLWLTTGGLVAWVGSLSRLDLGIEVILILLALQPAAELTNFFITRLLPPRFLPELDLENDNQTLGNLVVAVPTMLHETISSDVRRLELRFLANRLPGTAYGLLTDWSDAPAESMPGDAALLTMAVEAIVELSARYPDGRFFLFHRPRIFTPTERAWIGRERKRGKVEDFIALLARGINQEFLVVGDPSWLIGARYAASLDADTTLPPGTAARLFGAAAHPLNANYGFIQPHIATGYESATANGLSRLYHDQPGVDPYLRSFSDAYFDLSGDAIYHGKGVLNVERVYASLHNQLPSEQILSHDLIEGSYAGVGLATDIVLYDDFPASLSATAARDQRWARGDWQLIAWLGRTVKTADSRRANPLSVLNRYKVADNLRRTLVDPGSLVALGAGAASHQLVPVTLSILGLRLFPVLLTAPRSRAFWRAIGLSSRAKGYELSILPYRAFRLTDAILRALWRSGVSRHHLLQWRTAAEASATARTGLDLWFSAQLSIGVLMVVLDPMPVSIVWLAIWTGGLVWTYMLEQPRQRPSSPLTEDDRNYLRRIALQTWAFFDDYMTPANHFLPPDNYQVAFKNEVALRSSPTNIGLGLVAWLEGVEFGFTTPLSALSRIESSLKSLSALERYHGHYYNWYDVRTALPLGQRFVSTVDSGNFVMSLWALRGGLDAWLDQPLARTEQVQGLRDLLDELTSNVPHFPSALNDELRGAMNDTLAQEQGPSFVRSLHALTRLILARQPSLIESAATNSLSLKRFLRYATALEVHLTTYLLWYENLGDSAAKLSIVSPVVTEIAQMNVGQIPSIHQLLADEWRLRLSNIATDSLVSSGWNDLIDLFQSSRAASKRIEHRLGLATDTITNLASDTDFTFLYNRNRRTFHIGYDVDNEVLNRSYYDLLASEARTASFVAIASGQISAKHWWALGRNTRLIDGKVILLSWSGTMFEYLMPRLFLRNYPQTLLDNALSQATGAQRAQAKVLGVPWGISESGHSDLDADDTYQYHAYGVQSLAVQAVPEQGTVVAPYASCLALMIDPLSALANLRELEQIGMRGRYGFYEAIDYRRPYRPSGERGLIVYSYMAHHQGMSLLAISNVLHDDVVVRRVERDARVAAASPLLQERLARPNRRQAPVQLPVIRPLRPIEPIIIADSPSDLARPIPPQFAFTNGSLTSLVTARGSGTLRWKNYELNRWEADPLLEQGGLKLYLQDEATGENWLLGKPQVEGYRVESLPETLGFESTTGEVRSRVELMVAPNADVEIRSLKLTDESGTTRSLAITSLFEFGIADHNAQRAHPAFNQLFISTEGLPEFDGVLAHRRHRSDDEPHVFVAHILVNLTQPSKRAELGNDRTAFIGRVGNLAHPAGLDSPLELSVAIDPAAIVRQHVVLPAGGTVELALLTIVADSRDKVMALAERYRQISQIRRTRQAAWAGAEAELQRLQTSHAETEIFQRLGGYVTYPNAFLKMAASSLVATGHVSTSTPLAPQPIIVVVDDRTDLGLVRQLWLAAAYLNRRSYTLGLLVIVRVTSERRAEVEIALENLHGGMEALLGEQLPPFEVAFSNEITKADMASCVASAKIVLDAKAGSLIEQLSDVPRLAIPRNVTTPQLAVLAPSAAPNIPLSLGGFTGNGSTYTFDLAGHTTPAPWSNVISNSVFGTLVTERGSGFSWDGNSQQNRISPWRNDPAGDRPSEGWYIFEEADSSFWSVLPLPGELPQLHVEHSLGHTQWSGTRADIDFTVEVSVPIYETKVRRLRLSTVTLTNTSNRPRELIISHLTEVSGGRDMELDWIPMRSIWRTDPEVLLFQSTTSNLRDAVIFAALDRPTLDTTTSRGEATGPVADGLPYGLAEAKLSGRVGRNFRPVAALRTALSIGPGESVSITSFLGAANNEQEAVRAVARLQGESAHVQRDLAVRGWESLTGHITVRTPDPKLDVMMNHWLLYQVTSSRLWGRTGYYQSSGAFGFRDQLQDVMALVYTQPQLARQQILTAANHQFIEGDAQHWWQPLSLWGLRSKISDDRLWLPYVTAHYVRVTGDTDILNVDVPYLTGPALAPGQVEAYYGASVSPDSGTILDHCKRAIAVSMERGVHGLPLMGSGDWCDGYNRVGIKGTGETVWGAWFMSIVEEDFARLLLRVGGAPSAATALRTDADKLRQAATASWDGNWYLRGYYDDGSLLGSHESDEGQIDSLSQSWAVMAGQLTSRERHAYTSAVDRLVDDKAGIVRLLAPSFDKTLHDPGYIRGYLPGVRENGGQYTHGSVWLAIAAARLGESVQATHLLNLMLPTWHGAIKERQDRYAIEPYVMAGDVYALPGLEGRGGWSWYTGSAGWMYRAWLEEILGFRLSGDSLQLNPVIPPNWPSFEITYRYGETPYQLHVFNARSGGAEKYKLDGVPQDNASITLHDDGKSHVFEQWLG
jgi:cyclic beta-1,2-glucan synthetase